MLESSESVIGPSGRLLGSSESMIGPSRGLELVSDNMITPSGGMVGPSESLIGPSGGLLGSSERNSTSRVLRSERLINDRALCRGLVGYYKRLIVCFES